ncbi:MAG: hypothetical protein MPEBLZ_04235 [Candidatus Methanoperedens nitroreducens]|uniref:DUF998 domain-containing protein n=1 Tax=Candidatus Methanoperedens nitratireducens TaxID=1392998 RepID=A0A0P7ZZZ7_9EURY|nr:DUF998 domain-containing protein [Candidatus Methanoperedens sp. BLZ2]KAB2947369.1 MAG: DUF998 domain-containing protein [Candidatus Methanoperedens sp.]KPQ41212.1 MAG: hypothetical protein MPEBLZ_04235 [Candidatus Methanoperedens sp. BLZ1]MBZ0175487.1 DUF998 domain-containing protein [Candidatus Methanoperedens nitroreducens]CAG1001962.1 hypothetical protein METP2_03347 [Methanosarcinales archaeon]MCX9080220.1 DUF998 domain-containing protein [Candidatus Methanoperedens sp.]
MDNRGLAGAFMFVGGVQFAIGMVLAEIFYPGYNVSGNYISDLGATCRETCTIYQPSAFIFNTSAIFLGIFILLSSYCTWLEFKNYLISILIGLSGLGALGVGLFPETAGTLHLIVSLITFLFAALSAIAARNFVKPPFNFFSVFLGFVCLAALVLFGLEFYPGLGPGGMERMIAYPVLLWAIGFGGYLMHDQ